MIEFVFTITRYKNKQMMNNILNKNNNVKNITIYKKITASVFLRVFSVYVAIITGCVNPCIQYIGNKTQSKLL